MITIKILAAFIILALIANIITCLKSLTKEMESSRISLGMVAKVVGTFCVIWLITGGASAIDFL